MSLFSWFSRKSASSKPRSGAEPSGLLNADATVPLNPGRPGKPLVSPPPPDHAVNRKNERMERRELLYTVVRDAMVRAGVLSASYKFKVLSLDQRGRQFLVMMDLAREYGGETARLSEIEALIAQTAKTRYDIVVTAVYWRINDHVAVGIPQKGVAPQGASLYPPMAPPAGARRPPLAAAARPGASPLEQPARPAGTTTSPASAATASLPRSAQRFEPIEADEVAAFKRALAAAAGAPTASAVPSAVPSAASKPGVPVRSGPMLPPANHGAHTGFEDTEMPSADSRSPDLSTTQYGDLN
jgi:hypothetical protein